MIQTYFGFVLSFAGVLPGSSASWAEAVITPTATPPSGYTSEWVMAEDVAGQDSTQVGVMERAGQPPVVFWQDGTGEGNAYEPVATGFGQAVSGPVDVAVSCDFGTSTFHDWADVQIVHTVTLNVPCGSQGMNYLRETEGNDGQQPPTENTLGDVGGAAVTW